MSADDGYIVSRIHNDNAKYGIFRYAGDSREPSWFVEEHAMQVFDNPIGAIIKGLRINSLEATEYGVSVNSVVIGDAERFLQTFTRPIRKNYGPA